MHSVRTGLLVACCLVVTVCPQATAQPGPSSGKVAEAREAVRDRSRTLGAVSARLAAAEARLEELTATAEQRVEAYNGQLVRLAQAKERHEAAQARLATAEAEAEKARQAVA